MIWLLFKCSNSFIISYSLGKCLSKCRVKNEWTVTKDLINSFHIPFQSPAGSSGSADRFYLILHILSPADRQRITRVNLRDLIFCLEQERTTARSMLLYKALLK